MLCSDILTIRCTPYDSVQSKRGQVWGVSALDTQGSPTFSASYCRLMPPVLNVPVIVTSRFCPFVGEMAIKVSACG